MRFRVLVGVLLVALAGAGCARQKSTSELVGDLKSHDDKDRIVAVRLLGDRKADAAQTVPALIDALKDHDADVRRSAAIGLGNLGDRAKEAIPALEAAKGDRDARVREAAAVALSRIDPSRFSPPSKGAHAKR